MASFSLALFCGWVGNQWEQAQGVMEPRWRREGPSSKACQIHRMKLGREQVTAKAGCLQKGWDQGCTRSLDLGRQPRLE